MRSSNEKSKPRDESGTKPRKNAPSSQKTEKKAGKIEKMVLVKPGTGVIVDEKYKGKTEEITAQKARKRKLDQKKIVVKKGTGEPVGDDYEGSTEEIAYSTMRGRIKVRVRKGTGEPADDNYDGSTEEITHGTMRGRTKVRVKKGTAEPVDGDYDGSTEEMTYATMRARTKVRVKKGTVEPVDDDYDGPTEKIKNSTIRSRNKVSVKKGTSELVDDDYDGSTEEISNSTIRSRTKVRVKKGTGKLVNDDYDGSTEEIKYTTAMARKKVRVKTGTGEIVGEDYQGSTEKITLAAMRSRAIFRVKRGTGELADDDYDGSIEEITRVAMAGRKIVRVKKGTGELVNDDYHGSTEEIAYSTMRSRRKSFAKQNTGKETDISKEKKRVRKTNKDEQREEDSVSQKKQRKNSLPAEAVSEEKKLKKDGRKSRKRGRVDEESNPTEALIDIEQTADQKNTRLRKKARLEKAITARVIDLSGINAEEEIRIIREAAAETVKVESKSHKRKVENSKPSRTAKKVKIRDNASILPEHVLAKKEPGVLYKAASKKNEAAEDAVSMAIDADLSFPDSAEIKQEYAAAVINDPVLKFDKEAFMEVVRILRVNDAQYNCAYLTEDFIQYLRTGKKPEKPSSSEDCSAEHYLTWLDKRKKTIRVKAETGSYEKIVRTVTGASVDRNTFFGSRVPVREVFVEEDGLINLSLPPCYDLDRTRLYGAEFSAFEETLKNEAAKHSLRVSFGMVNIARCGNHVDEVLHLFVYHATPDQVVYIDPQAYNGLSGEGEPFYYNLTDMFTFAAQVKRITIDVFGVDVFYIPMINPVLNFGEPSAAEPNSAKTALISEPAPIQKRRKDPLPVQEKNWDNTGKKRPRSTLLTASDEEILKLAELPVEPVQKEEGQEKFRLHKKARVNKGPAAITFLDLTLDDQDVATSAQKP